MKKPHKKSTIISDRHCKPKVEQSKHYVDNKKFYAALKERKESGNSEVSEYIGKCIYDISHGLAQKYQFSNYTYKEAMISEGIEKCIRYIDSFDVVNYNNPFSYFTQTCYYAFLYIIKEEKKAQYVKYKSSVESLAMGELADINNNNNEGMQALLSNLDVPQEYISEFIGKYEQDNGLTRKEPKKRKKRTRDPNGNDVKDFF